MLECWTIYEQSMHTTLTVSAVWVAIAASWHQHTHKWMSGYDTETKIQQKSLSRWWIISKQTGTMRVTSGFDW